VLKYLSQGLYVDLIYEKNSNIFKNLRLFDKFHSTFVKQLYLSFKEELLGQNDLIFEDYNSLNLKSEEKLIFLI
jgi:hypothetical protein